MMKSPLLFTLLLPLALLGQTADDVARMMDERPLPDDMVSDMSMTLTSRQGKTRTLTVHSVRKGNEQQIIWFLAPADDRGVAFLKIEHDDRDDEMRMWLPSFKKMRRISSSKQGESFMGSDLTFEDMTSRELDEYTYALLGEEDVDSAACWMLESTPIPAIRSSYSRIVTWVRQSDALPVREENYNRAGQLEKQRVIEATEMDGFIVITRMFVENVIKQHSTELLFENIELNTGVTDKLFHERNLRRLPK